MPPTTSRSGSMASAIPAATRRGGKRVRKPATAISGNRACVTIVGTALERPYDHQNDDQGSCDAWDLIHDPQRAILQRPFACCQPLSVDPKPALIAAQSQHQH